MMPASMLLGAVAGKPWRICKSCLNDWAVGPGAEFHSWRPDFKQQASLTSRLEVWSVLVFCAAQMVPSHQASLLSGLLQGMIPADFGTVDIGWKTSSSTLYLYPSRQVCCWTL